MKHICLFCKKEFNTKKKIQKFCSPTCYHFNLRGGVGYWRNKKRDIDTNKKISNTLTGRKLPQNVIDKIKASNNNPLSFQKSDEGRKLASQNAKKRIYKPLSEKTKEILRKLRIGISPTLEARQKISEALKGDKHYNWKGGITKENMVIRRSMSYRLWRTAVFERDNYTCVLCNKRGCELNADHIKRFADYPELRLNINNGRTLCVPCHMKTDTRGRSNKI